MSTLQPEGPGAPLSKLPQPQPIQFAMKDGLFMGLYMVLNIALILIPSAVSGILLLLMMLFFPALYYIFVARYRDKALGGYISYARAFRYSLLLLFFSVIIFAGGQYIVYTILFSQQWFVESMQKGIESVREMGLYDQQTLEVLVEQIKQLTPFRLMLAICNWVILFGVLYSLILGLMVRRQK